ncbi:hypothetical protein LSAT2_032103 [Lamellibrachia satsuma]|nr:hypothetical protein LSAT2_032103 [Lamellibrachia satsuma]
MTTSTATIASTTSRVKMRGFLKMSLSVALVCLALLDVAVADVKCLQISGTCQYTSNYCSGSYLSGYCNGPSNRRCCIPDSRTGDSRCIAKGGHCQDESTCDGEALRGYCAGAANRKCCIAGSKALGAVSNDRRSGASSVSVVLSFSDQLVSTMILGGQV